MTAARRTPWWRFWNAGSGMIGGLIMGVVGLLLPTALITYLSGSVAPGWVLLSMLILVLAIAYVEHVIDRAQSETHDAHP